MTIYNRIDIKDELQKRIASLKKFCAENNLPMFLTIAIKNTETETKYMNDQLDPALLGVELYDDHIHEHLKILMGFTVVSKDVPIELDFDALKEPENMIRDEEPKQEKKTKTKKEEKKPKKEAKTKKEESPKKKGKKHE